MSGTVFIVDDDAAVCDSVSYLMTSVGLQVRSFPSAGEFLAAEIQSEPACLILDLRMPGVSGLEALDMIRSRHIELPTIIMTGHGDVPAAVRAMKLGAVDFLEKPCNDQLLLDKVQGAIAMDSRRKEQRATRAILDSNLSKLSERENQVMELVVSGKSNKETALVLGVSPKTVETHRANLMRKLEVGSLAELVKLVFSAKNTGFEQ